jgi:hypothetical protein
LALRLREEHRIKLSENKGLRIFGIKRDEVRVEKTMLRRRFDPTN